jgi:hypothetical protein
MKNWYFSVKGAIALSRIALITEVWRGFLDAMFVFPTDFADEGTMHAAALIFTLFFVGWVWLLVLTARGSRKGLIGNFLLNIVVVFLVPISWLLFYCPSACRVDAGFLFNLANNLNLIFGVLASISLGLQIWHETPQGSSSDDLQMEAV